MFDYSHVLGDTVKVAREPTGLTQAEVATAIDKDIRTILNIENYKGNPNLEEFHPLKIDQKKSFITKSRSIYQYSSVSSAY